MDAIGMESLTFLGNIGGLALALLGAGLAAALSASLRIFLLVFMDLMIVKQM